MPHSVTGDDLDMASSASRDHAWAGLLPMGLQLRQSASLAALGILALKHAGSARVKVGVVVAMNVNDPAIADELCLRNGLDLHLPGLLHLQWLLAACAKAGA